MKLKTLLYFCILLLVLHTTGVHAYQWPTVSKVKGVRPH